MVEKSMGPLVDFGSSGDCSSSFIDPIFYSDWFSFIETNSHIDHSYGGMDLNYFIEFALI
jgi:hypothetical protein